jgi:pyruvate dehydrogenase E2 component (dihydrolipoamide acetyltransferase)
MPSRPVARPVQPARKPVAANPGKDTRVPFVGLRRKIAERMTQSKNTAAHFTFVEECDASRLMSLRDRLKPEAQARGVELTYMPFIVKAVCTALRQHPMLNSSLDTETNELVMHGSCHIGIAAATDQGLVVPVLHQADQLPLFDLAAEINRLGVQARDGKLSVAELSGSTFTITSLGKQAGLFAVPILNLPNVGILGVHRIKERPVVRDGQIAIGQIMLLSLSLDHRIVDGHIGAAFAYEVIRYLEEPALMFMEL